MYIKTFTLKLTFIIKTYFYWTLLQISVRIKQKFPSKSRGIHGQYGAANFTCDPITFPQFNKRRQEGELEAYHSTICFSTLCEIFQSEKVSSAVATFGSDFKRSIAASEVKSTNVSNNPLIYTTGNASLLFWLFYCFLRFFFISPYTKYKPKEFYLFLH